MSQHKEQQGFVTFAINNTDTDYLELAYLQCLNVKATQKHNKYAVLVDTETLKSVTDRQRRVFDYIIELDNVSSEHADGSIYAWSKEPDVFRKTPFKETIKLEADLLFTRSIDHWWTAFRLRNVCLSTGALNYRSLKSDVRKYREVFDANQLPDVYNGLMYFRYSQEAAAFFNLAGLIFHYWADISKELKTCEDEPSTDVVYAIAARILGEELVTMPSMDFINFVHMKSGFNKWSDARSWIETVMAEHDGDVIRINNINQLNPVHYHEKTYATHELIKYYESRIPS